MDAEPAKAECRVIFQVHYDHEVYERNVLLETEHHLVIAGWGEPVVIKKEDAFATEFDARSEVICRIHALAGAYGERIAKHAARLIEIRKGT